MTLTIAPKVAARALNNRSRSADLKCLAAARPQATSGTSNGSRRSVVWITTCALDSEVVRGCSAVSRLRKRPWSRNTCPPQSEEENPQNPFWISMPRSNFDPVFVGQGVRELHAALLHLHGPLLRRPLEALGLRRAAVGSRDLRPRRAHRPAGARHPGLPRDRRRRLAQEPDFAVTFLDRYGNEIGQRGIRSDDSVPLDEMPDYLDQGGARHRGPPLLRPFRHRCDRHVPRAREQRAGRRRACRAARRSPSSSPRTCSSPTSAPSSARSRKPSSRSGSSANLSKNEILKLYLDRAYMGGGTFGVDGGGAVSISARRSRTSTSPRRRCWPACSRRRPNTRRTSTCRPPAPAPTWCSPTWSRPAS